MRRTAMLIRRIYLPSEPRNPQRLHPICEHLATAAKLQADARYDARPSPVRIGITGPGIAGTIHPPLPLPQLPLLKR
jgi:hypothetical protein